MAVTAVATLCATTAPILLMGFLVLPPGLSAAPIEEAITTGTHKSRYVLYLFNARRFVAVTKTRTAGLSRVYQKCVVQVKITGLDSCHDICHGHGGRCIVFIG